VTGARVAVFGLARSGLSVAKAAIALGADVTVFDEKPRELLKSTAVVDEAVALGADVQLGWTDEFSYIYDFVVTSPGVPFDHPKLQGALKRSVPIYSEVEFAYRIARAPIVAITGTNGKSTTTAMTYACLRAAAKSAILCGNIYGSGFDEVPLTEAALTATSDHILVAEVSSFQLEWVSAFRPVAAAITNITPDHLDRHKSFEEYRSAKHRIHAAQGAHDYAIINGDSPHAAWPGMPETLVFGEAGDYAIVEDNAIEFPGHIVKAEELAVYGEHNLMNAAAAVLLASAVLTRSEKDFSVPASVIKGIKEFPGIAHRMEWVGERDGVRLINNSMCTNPAAVVTSSKAIPAKQHLLVGGINKNLDFAPLKAHLAEIPQPVYLFGRDAESINEQLGGGHPVFQTMTEAFQRAIRNAKAGEVVMLAPGCASMDQFRDFEDRGNVFKTIAKEWLEQ